MAESDEQFVELPLDGAGTRLRRAREAAGLSLADLAARTRIAERHLVSIENGQFAEMASRAYAIGFSRSYARAVGLDEFEIAECVRNELAGQEPSSDRYLPAPFEPGDPARVPGPRIAWVAALGALAVIVIGYILWRSFYAPAMPLPDVAVEASAPAAASVAAQPSAVPPTAQGAVVFTALEPGVWVKFYDAAGNQLMQKQMALGETYTVPAGAANPMIRTARPDALQIAIGGQVVAKLADRQTTIGDVPVSAAALLARGAAGLPAAAIPPAAPTARTSTAPPATSRPVAAASPPAQRTLPASRPTGEAVRPARAALVPTPAAALAAPPLSATPLAGDAQAVPPQSSTVSQ